MTKAKKKTAWEHLATPRRGIPPKELTTVMVPPIEWTRAVVRANNDTVYVYDDPDLEPQRRHSVWLWHGRCDVHGVYWDWCDDEQKRRRELFLKWMSGPIEQVEREARRRPWRDPDPMAGRSTDHPPFVWELAEAIFPGLRLPALYKRGRTAKEAKAILDAVAEVHRTFPKRSVKDACQKAGISKTAFYDAGGKSWRTGRPEK